MSNASAQSKSNDSLTESSSLTAEGNADTKAVAGAAGTDVTGTTDYGSRKSPDGADDVRLCSDAVFYINAAKSATASR